MRYISSRWDDLWWLHSAANIARSQWFAGRELPQTLSSALRSWLRKSSSWPTAIFALASDAFDCRIAKGDQYGYVFRYWSMGAGEDNSRAGRITGEVFFTTVAGKLG
jgi:hypothetical protein